MTTRDRLGKAVAVKFWPNHNWDDAAGWQRDTAFDAVDTTIRELIGVFKTGQPWEHEARMVLADILDEPQQEDTAA